MSKISDILNETKQFIETNSNKEPKLIEQFAELRNKIEDSLECTFGLTDIIYNIVNGINTAEDAKCEKIKNIQQPAEKDNKDKTYNYIHKPAHYHVIGEYDVCDIANATGLNNDAYAFNILKYILRKNKPGEPRYRDIEKIKEYAEIWLKNFYQNNKNK